MTDPLSIAASVTGITTAAIASVRYLHTTISDIKDVPDTLNTLKADLQAVEKPLQKLLEPTRGGDSQVLLLENVEEAVTNCTSACSTFQIQLDRWMRHATRSKAFWAQWTDRVRVGMFEQGKIQRLQREAQRLQEYIGCDAKYLLCVSLCHDRSL